MTSWSGCVATRRGCESVSRRWRAPTRRERRGYHPRAHARARPPPDPPSARAPPPVAAEDRDPTPRFAGADTDSDTDTDELASDELARTDGASGLKLGHDLGGYLARARQLVLRHRDRADHRMSAPAVTLADLVDLVRARDQGPGVATHGDLGARAQRDRHGIARLREQVVRDELVERGHAAVGQVRYHDAPIQAGRCPDGLDV